MKKIFFIISTFFILFQNLHCLAAPNSEADAKIDLESLGLDSVDQKQNIAESAPKKSIEPAPAGKAQLINPVNKTEETIKANNNNSSTTSQNSANVNIDGSVKPENNSKILSKIQNFIKGKENDKNPSQEELSQNSIISNINNAIKTSKQDLQKIKKAKLRERIAAEKKKAAEKKALDKKRAKEERLNKLREQYLIEISSTIKDEDLSDEDFDKKENEKIIPKEKTLNWSDRFISYEPQPQPLVDPNRNSENKHIPILSSTEQRINDMFQVIISSNDAEDFNAHYKYVLDPNIRNANGETILTLATLLQKYAVVDSILAKGADPDLPNSLGHTALDIAIAILDLRLAQILINMNADITYTNGLGRNYLMNAAQVGFLPIVDLLVSQHLIDIDAIDNEGYTALEIAQKYKQEIVVKFLLKAGANPAVKKPHKISQHNLIKELENRWQTKPEAVIAK